ncbi:type VI secretion system Vgr family protein [Bacteroides xylanisolvens]|uniref:type VI secretion system Vgr family protein n=1 Tax=Bacteroides xylanisolvens TaxID=371601 RepID=UPI0039B57A6C
MSISIRNISVAIDGTKSTGFCIELDGTRWRLDNFMLSQSLLLSNFLSFSLHKEPDERINEISFNVCGAIIGKEIQISLETDNIEKESLKAENDSVADIEFVGVIVGASGSRSRSEFTVNVEACSWDALLNDNPTCKSFENLSLNDIVNDVVGDYSDHLESEIEARFTDTIPYCVQYNENNYQFLQRLARRYGEWLYNDGKKIVFGNLPKGENIKLVYPSCDVPSYNVDLKMRHVAFNHVASSYNSYDANQKEGVEEMQREYNTLSEQVFQASQSCFTKPTLQNLHSGGFADIDGRETILNISTKTQARGEKASMLTYSGTTYCSKIKIGSKLVIVDNYLPDTATLERSKVEQDEILITELVHTFSADETYSNCFVGIPSACDYPPYFDSDVYPIAQSCRAKVKDNEDPNNLGRVRVQFDWQAQLDDTMMTPWLRMAQPYAGGGKGFNFIPEIDEEVMIDFEGGNAERPYIKGTLYNGIGNPDGAWLPNNNSSNQIKAIRTRNGHTIEIHDEGNDGYIRIYDNEKENYILTFSTDEKLIKLESTGNIELYAQNDIIMHAGHDINASADNDIFIAASHDMQRTADNDIREHAGNDRSTSIDRNDLLTVESNQFVKVNDNKDEQVVHKLQVTAENIRIEATDKLLEYSNVHQQKANDSMAMNSGNRIDIKSGIVKVQ